MIECCLYGLNSSTCLSKPPLISKHKSSASGCSHALDRNPDANYRRCVDRDHDLYRATRLSSPSAGRSSNPGQLAPHSAVPGPPAFCRSPVGQPSTTCARRSRFFSMTCRLCTGFAKLAVKPKATAFLLRLHRERWGRTPHKVTTGTGVPMLFHTGRGGALFHCRFGRGLYVKAFPGAMLSNPICFNGQSSGTLRS
jgi:hypothetical protein